MRAQHREQVGVLGMANTYTVSGVNPMGRLVELVVTAQTQAGAKLQAEKSGLRFVTVKPGRPPVAPATPPGQPPRST